MYYGNIKFIVKIDLTSGLPGTKSHAFTHICAYLI